MKLLVVGFILWAFTLVIVARLVRLGSHAWPPSGRSVALWCLAVGAAVLLLFRPHQDFFGGQDQGAYANVAVSYARRGELSYTDPLLSKVPAETRPAFFYGDENFRDTKDMCFWVKDAESALIGTWFQPAFPVIMSVAAFLGPDTWVLYVTPLFTLLTAVALWALAGLLFDRRWAGAAAFVLYLVNPVTIWHGRGVRAEAAASFLLFAGCALLVRAWIERKHSPLPDILTGSICLALAPFFHVSAWLSVVPAAAVLALIALAGHTAFVVGPAAASIGLAAFLAQTKFITDCYELGPLAAFIFEHPPAWACVGVGLLSALGICSSFIRKRRNRGSAAHAETGSNRNVTIAAAALALATTVILILAYRNVFPGPVKNHPVWALRLVGITQLDAFATAVTRPLALAGVAGWLVLILRRDNGQLPRMALALTLFPALILVGDMPILMYFLRRSFITVTPVLALSLAALVSLLPAGRSPVNDLCTLAAIVLLALPGISRRGLLYTTTDYAGFPSFLRRFADVVKHDNGILLCEYSRIAAPFEHLFGIPTLGLDNERRFEYGPALDAWEKIIREDPGRPAFFMTPFGPPVDPRFSFTPVLSASHRMRFLRSAPGRLPVTIRRPLLTLSLYRMHPAGVPKSPAQVLDFPCVREFDETNMGLRSFHAGRTRAWEIAAHDLEPGRSCRLEPAADSISSVGDRIELVLICLCSTNDPPAPGVTIGGAAPGTGSWRRLAGQWWVYRARLSPPETGSAVAITPVAPMSLSAAMIVGDNATLRLTPEIPPSPPKEIEMFSRWARAEAQVAVPSPPNGRALLLMLVNPSHPAEHRNLRLRISTAEIAAPEYTMPMEVEGWQWLACPFPWSAVGPAVQWLGLNTTPPWNPGRYGYPTDLGLQIKYLAVLPGMENTDER